MISAALQHDVGCPEDAALVALMLSTLNLLAMSTNSSTLALSIAAMLTVKLTAFSQAKYRDSETVEGGWCCCSVHQKRTSGKEADTPNSSSSQTLLDKCTYVFNAPHPHTSQECTRFNRRGKWERALAGLYALGMVLPG
jgi:hypothetical protein